MQRSLILSSSSGLQKKRIAAGKHRCPKFLLISLKWNILFFQWKIPLQKAYKKFIGMEAKALSVSKILQAKELITRSVLVHLTLRFQIFQLQMPITKPQHQEMDP